jgi:hypothetical protein
VSALTLLGDVLVGMLDPRVSVVSSKTG